MFSALVFFKILICVVDCHSRTSSRRNSSESDRRNIHHLNSSAHSARSDPSPHESDATTSSNPTSPAPQRSTVPSEGARTRCRRRRKNATSSDVAVLSTNVSQTPTSRLSPGGGAPRDGTDSGNSGLSEDEHARLRCPSPRSRPPAVLPPGCISTAASAGRVTASPHSLASPSIRVTSPPDSPTHNVYTQSTPTSAMIPADHITCGQTNAASTTPQTTTASNPQTTTASTPPSTAGASATKSSRTASPGTTPPRRRSTTGTLASPSHRHRHLETRPSGVQGTATQSVIAAPEPGVVPVCTSVATSTAMRVAAGSATPRGGQSHSAASRCQPPSGPTDAGTESRPTSSVGAHARMFDTSGSYMLFFSMCFFHVHRTKRLHFIAYASDMLVCLSG